MRYLIIFTLLFNTLTFANTDKKNINASMVISGGISLGAYEAGYNWAIVNLLKRINKVNPNIKTNLLSVAGASAGSINALLTGVYWCQEDDSIQNSVDNNLFFDTWTGIDINDLTIQGDDPNNTSTLFTRKPIIDKANRIVEYMKKPIFKNGCKMPFGVMVTKSHPIKENFKGINIKNQSFAIPLTLTVKNRKLYVKNRTIQNRDPRGRESYYLYLLKIPNLEQNQNLLKDILYASSAFPGAFKQIKLNYIYKGKKGSDYFLDGGVYNNIPLDLALALAPNSNNFLFIDPNTLRDFNSNNCSNPAIKNFLKCNNCTKPNLHKKISKTEDKNLNVGFLKTNLLPLLKSTEIFRSLKLYEIINRYFRFNRNRDLIVSSRYHPITGNFVWAFGAFLDKNFREYDYYVGVYDAIYKFAQEARRKGFAKNIPLPILMQRYKKLLNIDKSKDASIVYNMLLKAEFCNKLPNKTSNRFAAIYDAFNLNLIDTQRYSLSEFKNFIKKLDISNMHLKEDSFLAYAKENPDDWYKPITQTFIERVTLLENEKAKIDPSYRPIARSISFSAWLGMSHLITKKGFVWQPLLIPKNNDDYLYIGYKLIPHEFAIDSANGGFSLGYSLYWYQKMALFDGIEFKLSYNHGKHIDDHLRLDIDPFVNLKKSITLGAGVSVFANLQHRAFWERESAFGANAYIDYSDIFRLTYVRRFHNRNKYYIYFGVKNLSSLLYWLNR